MSSTRSKLDRTKRRFAAAYRRGYEDGKRDAQQELGVRWLPVDQADRSITDVQDFSEVGITLRLSDRYWVRDADGRIYEAVWTDDKNGYWWDLEGESPADPVEFMPHPLANVTPSQQTAQEDADCCIACDVPFIEGDLVYWDVNDTGYLHAACCGPEREGYVNEDGAPLKDGDPVPQPFPYKPDRVAGFIYTGGEKE